LGFWIFLSAKSLMPKAQSAMQNQYNQSHPQEGTIPSLPQPQVDYAGFWLRFVAFLIDSIILGIASIFIMFITGGFAFFSAMSLSSPEAVSFGNAFFPSILYYIIPWLYYAFLESSTKQATLGKMALGIVVTDMNGNQISFLRATGRYFGKFISGFILAIGYIMAGFTVRKQALHDMIASCLVLVKR